ncbi:lasso peptide biosynthesis B2 protein [Sphingomonas koreensis]
MQLATRSDVFFCRLGQQVVFLDAARDRYFGTSPEIASAIMRAAEQCPKLPGDEALLEPLLADGLLVATCDEGRRLQPTSHSPARAEWGDWQRPPWMLVAQSLATQLRVAANLQRMGLAAMIRQRRAPKRCRQPRRRAAAIISAHRATDLILSANQRCLTKSLGLYELLRSAGYRPKLVIGVRDRPFAAHAWVELDDAVANDRIDHIALFQPILVL